MLIYILRRLASLPLVMLALTLLIVGLLQFLSPRERAASFIKNENQMRNIELIIKENGLDQPFYVQYWKWLGNAVQGNFGFSKSSSLPVLDTVIQRFPATLELAIFASLIIIPLAVWLGTLSALGKDKFLDQALRVFSVIGYSLPTFVVGILLLVVFYGALGILPGFGRTDTVLAITDPVPIVTGMITIDSILAGKWNVLVNALQHMILPVITLATIQIASTLKVMRNQLLDVLKADYVRTARAKGLSNNIVNIKHARRNAILPIVTLAGFTIQGLLSGAVITETIFSYPGIGSWGANAAVQLDYAGVMGFALFIGVIVVLSNLVIDLLYGFFDPRVRFD
jgi:ABC-type dipeptide/oligopeptide/nickel transport system permease component